MPSSYCDSLTVTVLPQLLALIHIPRSRLVQFSHQVVKQILSPSSPFLNITCNKVELSLFADHSVLAEFEALARKDRQRYKRASSSHRSPRTRYQKRSLNLIEPVEVSYDTWNVLQLDAHDDRLDTAGTRVRELSAPLAEAGISILYQSSYTSDFIFVKTSRLNEVLARLSQAGFVSYSDIPPHISPDESAQDNNSDKDPAIRTSFDGSELVLQRDSTSAQASPLPSDSDTVIPSGTPGRFRAAVSPCGPRDVQIYHQEIVCVGLSNAAADVWTSKIIKLVAYPELLIPETTKRTFSTEALPRMDEEMSQERVGQDPSPRSRPQLRLYTSPLASSSSSPSCSSSEDGYFSSDLPSSPSRTSPRASILAASQSFPELGKAFVSASNSHPYQVNTLTAHLLSYIKPFKKSSDDPVPFFSFTRTSDSSSLTAGREVIAALFYPNERHMIICGNELNPSPDEEGEDEYGGDRHSPSLAPSTMTCLEIDLQPFGLDKHGLINRFSKALDSCGINHMYSSTYKTANLLVNKRDARRAATLLRSC